MYRTALVFGIILAALGVVFGAFGAHGLKQIVDIAQLQVFETAVRYQMYHSFAMVCTGIISSFLPIKIFKWATAFFAAGILMFSGSLYFMVLLSIKGTIGIGGLGILTPIGGLCFIIGWVLLLIGVLRGRNLPLI
jgi:uncharacterized membrane protein YgdD (TMEM256/DUF423 family)